jgi:hypothetical protein
MRTSVTSRHELLPSVLRGAALVLIGAGVSVIASPLAGGVILAVGLVLLISYEATRPSGLLRAAEHAPHPHGGSGHVVVVADIALAGDEIADAIVKVVTNGDRKTRWAEKRELERARAELDIPVIHVAV